MAKQHSVFSQFEATRVVEPEMTFQWELKETSTDVEVICRYGGGRDKSNVATASIPYDSVEPVTVAQTVPNPAINVVGTVSAIWFHDGYAVSFNGNMIRPNYLNLAAGPAIVGASLNGELALAARQ